MRDIDLLQVARPGRYINSEWNVIKKDLRKIKIKIALCFPDVYEIGMSNLGMRIIYAILNHQRDVFCDRVFSPWPDMQRLLHRNKKSLFSLEMNLPLNEFDILGFSIGYELNYTNILDILDLSNIPLRSEDRNGNFPLIIAGGSCIVNPEPISEFFDLFVIGEGEEAIIEVIDIYRRYKIKRSKRYKGAVDKKELLLELSGIAGVYIPSFYSVSYNSCGRIKSISRNNSNVPQIIEKRFIKDLNKTFYPLAWLVPHLGIVHDRIALEIMRGCPNKCRFCQARFIYWPYRIRKVDRIIQLARKLYKSTGYEEISLCGLSVCDHPQIIQIISQLVNIFKEKGISLSLSSLRADLIIRGIPELISQIKKTSFTFAPEVGTKRLCNIINKDSNVESLLEIANKAAGIGYRHLKLYFMIGLLKETQQDLDAILDILDKLLNIKNKSFLNINVSINPFIPKPHTPFQWLGMQNLDTIYKKIDYIKQRFGSNFSHFNKRRVKFSFHDPAVSFLEAVFSKGDRRLADTILSAWNKGARFDAWREYFSFGTWMDAFKTNKIDPAEYAYRRFKENEPLCWGHINLGSSKEQLLAEYNQALKA